MKPWKRKRNYNWGESPSTIKFRWDKVISRENPLPWCSLYFNIFLISKLQEVQTSKFKKKSQMLFLKMLKMRKHLAKLVLSTVHFIKVVTPYAWFYPPTIKFAKSTFYTELKVWLWKWKGYHKAFCYIRSSLLSFINTFHSTECTKVDHIYRKLFSLTWRIAL